ncbi:MAG: hypothetical protein M0C28_15805 [Candidatus Moduliflexus flocculans]|nr:hypothetical protein [Candidatus Moduliflexus flocculans]
MLMTKNIQKAIEACNKVLKKHLQADNKAIKELPCEAFIFLEAADYFYTNQLDKAKADIETSLKLWLRTRNSNKEQKKPLPLLKKREQVTLKLFQNMSKRLMFPSLI